MTAVNPTYSLDNLVAQFKVDHLLSQQVRLTSSSQNITASCCCLLLLYIYVFTAALPVLLFQVLCVFLHVEALEFQG